MSQPTSPAPQRFQPPPVPITKTARRSNYSHWGPEMAALRKLVNDLLKNERRLVHLNTSASQDEVIEFEWPVDPHTRERVHPEAWDEYRHTFAFRLPCCLCGLAGEGYKESVLFRCSDTSKSSIRGKWAVACRNFSCGYFVLLGNLHLNVNLPFRVYPYRHIDAPADSLAPVKLPSDNDLYDYINGRRKEGSSSTPVTPTPAAGQKRKATNSQPSTPAGPSTKRQKIYGQDGKKATHFDPLGSLPSKKPEPDMVDPPVGMLLWKLDDEGLPLHKLRKILVVCDRCQAWVGSESAFRLHHYCIGPAAIDLTLDSSDDDSGSEDDEVAGSETLAGSSQ